MGRYSRKDMIEFAAFAKSYQSPRKVEDAYAAYLGGARLVTSHNFSTSLFRTIMNAHKVFVNGMCIKNHYPDEVVQFDFNDLNLFTIDSWDNKSKILHLKTKSSETKQLTRRGIRPLTEGKTKTNVKHYPNGIPTKKGPPPSPRVKRNE